jgi:hypothetical protein
MGDANTEIRTFTIYHIPGRKIGCTANLQHRTYDYRREEYNGPIEIVETFIGTAEEAGDREHELADQHGYPRGPHYAMNNWSVKMTPQQLSDGGKIGGKKTAELGIGCHAPEHRGKDARSRGKIGGQISGKKVVELRIGCHAPGQQAKGGQIAGKQAAELGIGCHAPGQAAKGGKIGGKIAGKKIAHRNPVRVDGRVDSRSPGRKGVPSREPFEACLKPVPQ